MREGARIHILGRLRALLGGLAAHGCEGFRRRDAYYANPIADVVYYELDLTAR